MIGKLSSWTRPNRDVISNCRSEFEYTIEVESTEAHPASFGAGAVSPFGMWVIFSSNYADCVVE